MKELIVTLACLMSAAGGPVFAGDYEAGKEKAAACAACHGPDGNKPITPDIPRLGGQYYD
jgi:cytochrome c553